MNEGSGLHRIHFAVLYSFIRGILSLNGFVTPDLCSMPSLNGFCFFHMTH
jgi:hypothetical protein